MCRTVALPLALEMRHKVVYGLRVNVYTGEANGAGRGGEYSAENITTV